MNIAFKLPTKYFLFFQFSDQQKNSSSATRHFGTILHEKKWVSEKKTLILAKNLNQSMKFF